MPRPTLPESFASLHTYDVKTTKTTEDDLWEHFCKMKKKVAEVGTRYLDIILDASTYFQLGERNPYYRHNWRNGSPSRDRKGILSDHVLGKEFSNGEDCKFQTNHIMIVSTVKDFVYCSEVFNWYETRNAEECHEMYELFSSYSYKFKQAEENYDENEDMCYYQARKRWETKDKEWIIERDLKKSHEGHRLRHEWEEAFHGDAGMREFYYNVIPDTETSCKYCIDRKKIVDASREIRRMQEQQQEENTFRHQREEAASSSEEEKEVKDEKEEFNPDLPTMTCETCNYSTQNKYSYKLHMDSKIHKRKEKFMALYCKDCNYHARCEAEMIAHTNSKKHKIQIGEIVSKEEQVFFCEACEYHAANQTVYDIHCKSQKHKRNTGQLAPKTKKQFHCETCDYYAPNNWLFEQHCASNKHHKRMAKQTSESSAENSQEESCAVTVPEIKQEC
jgi:hypothetical protein